jgi:hypothetical protein
MRLKVWLLIITEEVSVYCGVNSRVSDLASEEMTFISWFARTEITDRRIKVNRKKYLLFMLPMLLIEK